MTNMHHPPYPAGLEATQRRNDRLVDDHHFFHVTAQGILPPGCLREAIVVAESAREAITCAFLYVLHAKAPPWPEPEDVIASYAGRPCLVAFNEASDECGVLVAKWEAGDRKVKVGGLCEEGT